MTSEEQKYPIGRFQKPEEISKEVRQVVNHCADSHMNALLRIKLALTEEKPTVTSYFEERWAELEDSKRISIEPALRMLQGIHDRWTVLLNSLSEEQLERSYVHPAHGKEVSIKEVIALYAWHGNHHLAHVNMLKKRQGWE